MKRSLLFVLVGLLAACGDGSNAPSPTPSGDSHATWPQFGHDPQHAGAVDVAGQAPARIVARAVLDPFVPAETAETHGSLLVHYQAPLVEGNDAYVPVMGGTFTACNPPGSRQ